jgi:uncharacterized membrane protein SpoIIM required for sporulation
VDVDVFTGAHAKAWRRLEELTSASRLTGAEADELVQLYRQGSTQLSQLRSTAPDPGLVSQLSILLVKARGRIGTPHNLTWAAIGEFFTRTIPAALYRIRWWSVAATAFCMIVALAAGFWCVANPEAIGLVLSERGQEEYVNEAFAQYYSEYPHASFSAKVWTNNARIAAICVAAGITGILPLQVLFSNSLSLGVVAALMHNHGADYVFWTLILPHGLLELSCVFVAGAAGVRLLWAWLVPGGRTRAKSLADEGRSTIIVVVALTLFLGLSGILEGFVTPSSLHPGLKIGIGAAACALLWWTTFWVGRRATEMGVVTTVSEDEAAAEVKGSA